MVKVTITGADFVVLQDTRGEGLSSFIAATKRAEAFVLKHSEGNHVRSLFGLTLYTHSAADFWRISRAIRAESLTYFYAFV